MDDLISRQEALEKVRTMQTYKLFMGDDMILVDKAEVQTELMMLQGAQPEVLACGSGELVAQPELTDIDAREAVYNLAEKIGIHQLFALTVELRGEPIQPEPHEGHWIDKGDDGDWAWQIDGRGNSWHVWGCSECGKSVFAKSSYCPNCGAKMTISTK